MELVDASKALRLTQFAVRRYRNLNGVDSEAPGSPAAADVAAFRSRFPDGDESIVHVVAWVAHSLLVAAEDHMEGLARAFDGEHLTFAPTTIARDAIEAAAQTRWLLNPHDGAAGRLGRSASLQIAGAHEIAKVNRVMGRDDIAAVDSQLPITEAEAIGLTVCRPTRGTPFVEGCRPPNRTDLVAEALGGAGGEVAYRLLCSGAHSTTYSTLGRMFVDRDPDVIEGHAGRGLSRQEIGGLTAWTTSVYLAGLHRWSNYIGWDPDLVDQLRVLTGFAHLVDNVETHA